MSYVVTEADKQALQQLKNKFLKLLAPSGLTFDPLIEGYVDPESSIFGHIPFPLTERKGTGPDKSTYRFGKFYLHAYVYKVDSMKKQAYLIKFYRQIDMRLFRKKTWDENREANKIFVYGDTPEEAFEKFLDAMAGEDYMAYDLEAHPHTIVRDYRNSDAVANNSQQQTLP